MWAALGLVFIALALECLAFVIKIFLPPDHATLQRRKETEDQRTETELAPVFGEVRVLIAKEYVREYKACVPAVLRGMAASIADEVKEDTANFVIPGIRTEMASRAFETAHASVAHAQHRTGNTSLDLLRRLNNLGVAVKDAMGAHPYGSKPAVSKP